MRDPMKYHWLPPDPPRIPRLPLTVGDAGLMILACLVLLGAATALAFAAIAVRHLAQGFFV